MFSSQWIFGMTSMKQETGVANSIDIKLDFTLL